MFETLKRLFEEGKINSPQIETAVVKGWITQAQSDEIEGDAND